MNMGEYPLNVELSLLAQGQSMRDILISFAPLIVLLVLFYFLVLMPQARRQRRTAEMLQALKPGDKVITNGGIYGTVAGVEGDTLQLRISDQVKIKIARAAVAALQQESKES